MQAATLFLYWMDRHRAAVARETLPRDGFRVRSARFTPCQTLHARDDDAVFAAPGVWSRMCRRQSTWFGASDKADLTMVVTARRLPRSFEDLLEAEISVSDVPPPDAASREALEELVDSVVYREKRPDGWEDLGFADAALLKALFTLTGFWGRGDDLRRHWLGHRANHANFLARHHTVEIDGEDVPTSVTGTEGVCSSCAEVFNVVAPDSRKLVRACPGSVLFGGAPRDSLLDVRPVRIGRRSTA